jgi:hypothetical protein
VHRLLVNANVIPTSPILVTLLMEAMCSSETSVLTRATRRNIPEDSILHSQHREILKTYTALTSWALKRRRNVFPVKYKLGSYTPEEGILHSHRRDNLGSFYGFISNQTKTNSVALCPQANYTD